MIFVKPNNILQTQAINEVYIGKTPELIAMENQLDVFREKYLGRYVINMRVNSDEDLLKFDRMMEDYFGFGCFTLQIHNQAIANAFTLPIDTRFDYNNNGNDLIVDKKSFKFKKEADYSCMIGIYSGIIFNPDFTTEEVMACIMHEVGHNFNSSINRSNGALMKNYISLIWGIEIVQLLSGSFDLDLIKNNNDWRIFVDKTTRKWRKNNSLIIAIYDLIKQIKAIGYAVMTEGISVANALSLGLLTPLLVVWNGVWGLLTVGNPISALIKLIMKMFSLSALYPDEQTADNFATMYGYGSATISLHAKFRDTPQNSATVVMNMVDKIPIISTLIHLNELPAYILLGLFDPHPEALIRCKDQLELLEREVNKGDIDPKMRKVILSDIKECEKQIKLLTQKTNAIEDPYAAQKAYNRLLEKMIPNDGGFKKRTFGSKDKFDQYDNAYSKALLRSESNIADCVEYMPVDE